MSAPSSGGGDKKSAVSGGAVFGTVATLAVFAYIFSNVSTWLSSGSSETNDQPTITIAGETLLLSRRTDGGMETEPFFVGTRRVGVPIGNQQCIHIGRNGKKVVLVGTDGAYEDSFEAYYKSASKKTVKVTVIYYPFSSTFCEHLHKGKQAEDDGNA
jgi:hypothetical protein